MQKIQAQFIAGALSGIIFAVVLLVGFFVFSGGEAVAQDIFGVNYGVNAGLATQDVRITIVNIIRIALGILGVIALILVLYAGFVWMTSAGRADRIDLARKILLNAVIGLLIVLLAFAIVQYIFSVLQGSQAGPPGGGQSCVPNVCSGCFRCNAAGTGSFRDPSCSAGCTLPGNTFDLRAMETSHIGTRNDENVYLCSSVQAKFNSSLDGQTVTAALNNPANQLRILDTSSNTNVPGTWTTSGKTVIFKHVGNDFLPSTLHQVFLPKTITDSSGLPLSVCNLGLTEACDEETNEYFRWDFNTGTENDPDPPTITSAYPRIDPNDPDRNVSTDPVIQVNFSEEIDITTIMNPSNPPRPWPSAFTLQQIGGPGGAASSTINENDLIVDDGLARGFRIKLDNGVALEPFTWYRLTVAEVGDLCNNIMPPPPVTWEFQTNGLAAGVSSWSPKGSNVCPATTINVNFSTSMFYDQVTLDLAQGVPGNIIMSYTMRASSIGSPPQNYSISDAAGTFTILDGTDPVSSNFRKFELVPNAQLAANESYFVNITTDKVIDPDGTMLQHQWQFDISSAATCACAPFITSLSPAQGPGGQCMTIKGRCFAGTANFSASVPGVNFVNLATPAQSRTDPPSGSGTTFVTTTIPLEYTPGAPVNQGDTIAVSVHLQYNNVTLGTLVSNEETFFVDSAGIAQGPCLWSLSPVQGCIATPIDLSGERFGPDPGAATAANHIAFTSGVGEVWVDSYSAWNETQIQNALVPDGSIDGDVSVTVGGLSSNPIPFDISCSAGQRCSAAPAPICQPQVSNCPNTTEYICSDTCQCEKITTPPAPGTPRVIKADPTCSQSCPNVVISGQFNIDMLRTSVEDNANIDVLPCLDATCTSFAAEAAYQTPAFDYDDATRIVYIFPAGLSVDTDYRVIFKESMVSLNGVALGGLNYDADGNGVDDSYSWTFKTKTEACQLQSIDVTPVSTTLTSIGATRTFRALALGSNVQCGSQNINPNQFSWTWRAQDLLGTNVASVQLNQGAACSSNGQCSSGNCDPIGGGCVGAPPKTVATVNASAVEGNQSEIHATTQGFDDFGLLTYDPVTCDETTDCTNSGQCPGSFCDPLLSICTPVIADQDGDGQAMTPQDGSIGTWLTIEGCYFGSRRGAVNYTGGALGLWPSATVPQCSATEWSNNQIISEVPNELTPDPSDDAQSGAITVTTHASAGGLSASSNNSFIVSSNVYPALCGLNPTQGRVADLVTLAGKDFGGSQAAGDRVEFFNTLAAVNYPLWSENSVAAEVPTGAQTGNLYLFNNNIASNPLSFTVLPGGLGANCSSESAPACSPEDNLCSVSGLYCHRTNCICDPAPAPQVLSLAPSGPNQCRNPLIQITFNQQMNRSSLAGATNLERDNGTCDCATEYLSNSGSCVPLVSSENLFSRLVKILKQLFNFKLQAQGPNFCPVAGRVSSYNVAEGESGCSGSFLTEGCTVATLAPFGALQPDATYRIRVGVGAESSFGVPLATGQTGSFQTGSNICQLDRVQVRIFPPDFGRVGNSDTFFCAESNSCEGDRDPGSPGNQHDWQAEALDASGTALAGFTFQWEEFDLNNIFTASTLLGPDITITPRALNGRATFQVGAHPPPGPLEASWGRATTTVTATTNICENPWPSLANFPFVDTTYNFSLFYCRDRGVSGPDGDLPALVVPPQMTNYSSGNLLRDYLFLREGSSIDAVGLRIFANPDRLSPAAWYDAFAPNPGNPSTITVDGYDAIRDGQTVYVNGANLVGNSQAYTNIFLVSLSDGADSDSQQIYNQLLDNWLFTINVANINVCSTTMQFCSFDTDCPTGEICQADGDKLRRDTKRVSDIGGIGHFLDDYFAVNGTYPSLASGTFIPGQSTSRWPSWQTVLGPQLGAALPKDPVNEFNACPVSSGYDPISCFNENLSPKFVCPNGSQIYQYQVSGGGSGYSLSANPEFKGISWQGTKQRTVSGNSCQSFNIGP